MVYNLNVIRQGFCVFKELGFMIEFYILFIMIFVYKNLDFKNMFMIGRFKKIYRYLMFVRFFFNIWSCVIIKLQELVNILILKGEQILSIDCLINLLIIYWIFIGFQILCLLLRVKFGIMYMVSFMVRLRSGKDLCR